jgi:hypothetical protein
MRFTPSSAFFQEHLLGRGIGADLPDGVIQQL